MPLHLHAVFCHAECGLELGLGSSSPIAAMDLLHPDRGFTHQRRCNVRQAHEEEANIRQLQQRQLDATTSQLRESEQRPTEVMETIVEIFEKRRQLQAQLHELSSVRDIV